MSVELSPPFRMAHADDADTLARLVNMAGDGIPLHLWTGWAADGQDPWEIGRSRQAEKAAKGRVYAIDEGHGVVAALTGYIVADTPEVIDDDTPRLFRALIELENLVPGSWYVNVLATLPEARGKGHATRLLTLAETLARDAGCETMSIVVADTNSAARALYQRQGYDETATRPIDHDGWESASREWLLLVKPLSR